MKCATAREASKPKQKEPSANNFNIPLHIVFRYPNYHQPGGWRFRSCQPSCGRQSRRAWETTAVGCWWRPWSVGRPGRFPWSPWRTAASTSIQLKRASKTPPPHLDLSLESGNVLGSEGVLVVVECLFGLKCNWLGTVLGLGVNEDSNRQVWKYPPPPPTSTRSLRCLSFSWLDSASRTIWLISSSERPGRLALKHKIIWTPTSGRLDSDLLLFASGLIRGADVDDTL